MNSRCGGFFKDCDEVHSGDRRQDFGPFAFRRDRPRGGWRWGWNADKLVCLFCRDAYTLVALQRDYERVA